MGYHLCLLGSFLKVESEESEASEAQVRGRTLLLCIAD